ncbi:MAG: VWA domain-containing protein, partial [Deltaproteobacteria bacterium]|nr:VWA domain-containing protein [Deltaproteobacteria bacterium]
MSRALLVLALFPLSGPGCAGKAPCPGGDLAVAGSLRTLLAEVSFDAARATLTHVRHPDPWEDGRIDRVVLELAHGSACTLTVTAEGCADAAGRLPVTGATFVATAVCPGFPVGRTWLKHASETLGVLTLGEPRVPGTDQADACFAGQLTLTLEGVMHPVTGTDDPLAIQPSEVVVRGDLVSEGVDPALSACGYEAGDVTPGSGDAGMEISDGRDGAPELLAGEPAVALEIRCPDCTTDATVRVNVTAGETAGMPGYVLVFHEPQFPLSATLPQALDPAGTAVPWPAGPATFQAWQDTVPGGSVARAGEPLSPPVTVSLAPDVVTVVTLELDATGETTVSCPPGQWFCLDLETAAECNGEGDWYEELACPFGNQCSEVTGTCQSVVCMPGQTSCAGAGSWHKCLPSGTGYSVETPCPDGMVCAGGSCLKEECLSQVVFLVDTSQSMTQHWDAVRGSIDALMDASPLSYTGLATFPTFNTICDVPAAFQVPFAEDAGPDVVAWFDDHQPSGQTPLLAALHTMVQVLPATFPAGGALVVLSDGADTCAYPAMSVEEREALIEQELGEVTASLFSDHGIKTVVVGYNYQGNPGQLDAIATNGGTGMQAHTPAGNEAELTGALLALVDDL